MSVLIARGVGVRRRRRWLFRDLDLTVEPGDIVAVIGPPGSGRTTAVLALAGRFRLSAGSVAFGRTPSLGHVPEADAPEPVFTVAEHVRERLALLGRPRSEATDIDLHGLEPGRPGRDLTRYEKQVLGLLLASLNEPQVIALDGLDDGLDAGLLAEAEGLGRLAGQRREEARHLDGLEVVEAELVARRDAAPGASSPVAIPGHATICQCNGVTKAAICAAWEDGARTPGDIAARTRASTGCGTCRDAVEGITAWLAAAEPGLVPVRRTPRPPPPCGRRFADVTPAKTADNAAGPG